MRALCVEDFDFELLPRADVLPDGAIDDDALARIKSEELHRIKSGCQPRFSTTLKATDLQDVLRAESIAMANLYHSLHPWQLAPMTWWLYDNGAPETLWHAMLAALLDNPSAPFLIDHSMWMPHLYLLYKIGRTGGEDLEELPDAPVHRLYQTDVRAGLVWYTRRDNALRNSVSGNLVSIEVETSAIIACDKYGGRVVIDAPTLGIPLRRPET